MKIKAYFITYKNNEELNKTLNSFAFSGILGHDFEAIIVNNSVDVPIANNSRLPIRVIENHTRPSFSTGHLSRNWNECLIDGFKNVDNPDCDIIILSQNDNEFLPDVIDKLIESHKTYSFIQNGGGDTFHSYTVDSIKKVGLWDERFCGIGYQESDYFLRQLLCNPNGCSIGDKMHERVHNPLDYDIVDYNKINGFFRADTHHLESKKYHEISKIVFASKWGAMNHQAWDEHTRATAELRQYTDRQGMMYPYFEGVFAIGNPNYNYHENNNQP